MRVFLAWSAWLVAVLVLTVGMVGLGVWAGRQGLKTQIEYRFVPVECGGAVPGKPVMPQ